MNKNTSNGHDGVEQQALHAFTESAYLDYSMYVILDRALPHLADGLKPVQRRIIYAMSELGLSSQAKFKKSARTVGDVLGKFHPHGDSACYEAMVLMAQSFSYRYPFVDGQGNWGSMDDPKSFAAMRYTEARLSAYADVLLKELGQGTVEWSPNFDGSLNEPNLLPARLPNILLNGASGIAVGMSTDIPPHNLIEVTNACIHLLANPNASAEDLCEFVKGPDYPSDAEIISSPEDIKKIYTNGGGGLRMRAIYHTENGDIVITALPHLVSGSKILEQIAQLMQNKKVLQISDLRDESDHEHPIRLIITPKNSKIDNQALMNQLFASTDLERTYRVNVNVIGLDNKPKVKDLSALLSEWLQFRQSTVLKRLQTRLTIVVKRLHILDGLLICFRRLDDVIALIRQSDEAKLELMKQFKLSETQAEAILELKLRQLAKLEEHKIKSEQANLVLEKAELDELIDNPRKLKNLIKKELQQDAKTFGNPRRSRIIERPAAQALAKEVTPDEPVTVVLSKQAWIRSAKGHEIDPLSLSYKSGDAYEASVNCMSRTPIVFIDNFGRAYTLLPNSLPSARGQGEPLSTKVDLPDGAKIKALIAATKTSQFVLLSSAGYGFKIEFQDMLGKNKKGKGLLKLSGVVELSYACNIDNKANRLVLLTLSGQLLIVSIAELPVMTKGKGSRIIHLKKDDELCALIALKPGQGLSLSTGKKVIKFKTNELKEYCAALGSKGIKLKTKIAANTSLIGV